MMPAAVTGLVKHVPRSEQCAFGAASLVLLFGCLLPDVSAKDDRPSKLRPAESSADGAIVDGGVADRPKEMSTAGGSSQEHASIQCPTGACGRGGHCVSIGSDYVCMCESGYSGTGSKMCMNADDCPKDACAPGKCIDGVNTYSCECSEGYTGTGSRTCSPIDDCSKGACSPGKCVDGSKGFTCDCPEGFAGTGTQSCKAMDDCPPNACQPGGTCVDMSGDYMCSCKLPSPDKKQCPYILNEHGVFDSTTNLTWFTGYMTLTQGSSNKEDAKAFCAKQLSGPWRLPNAREAQTLPRAYPTREDLCFVTDTEPFCPTGTSLATGLVKVHCVM